jgi:uncharacterized membrane protein YoaK (UPF0700 family)
MTSTTPPARRDPSPVSRALVAMALAVVAGFVDAVGFLHVVAVFPANQSGNVAFLGLSIGGASPAPGWAPPMAIAAFMVGAAVGRWSSLRVGPRRGAATLLGLELVLLTGLAVVFLVAGENEPFTTTAARVTALAAAALAMGLQTDVIRAVAGVAVSTTYLTGAIARIGETIGTPPSSRERASGRRLLVVLSVVLIAYVGGAALGASRLGDGRTGLLVPAALVAGLLVVALARPWS